MELTKLLPIIGALITTGLGVMALVSPKIASKFTNMSPEGLIGLSEIRATYGGFFIALGASCLYLQADTTYFIAGISWIGAAFGRTFSVFVDKSTGMKNFGGIVFESVIGITLLFPYIKNSTSN
jgi:hypothetical protein